MELPIDLKTASAALTWVNSSKNPHAMFDRILEFCAKKQMKAHRHDAASLSVRKTSFSERECARIDKASEWVREYIRWRDTRRALDEAAGAQAFLNQLQQPTPVTREDGKTQYRRRYEFPTAKTLRGWLRKFESNKFSLAGNYSTCGRKPEIADAVLLSSICSRSLFPRMSINKISREMRAHRVLSSLKGTAPSTLRSWTARIPRAEWDMLQFGEKAHYQRAYAGSPIPAELPGDLVQIDFGIVDLWTTDDMAGKFVQPFLLAAMDVKTRAYLGGVLTLYHPKVSDVLMLLKSVLLPKPTRFHQLLCRPSTVQFDNGSIFKAPEIDGALRTLNIDPHAIDRERPTSNSVVERGFRLIGDEFVSMFARFVEHRADYGGTQDVPAIDFRVLQQELDQWFYEYNFIRNHSKHDAPPAAVWRDLTAGRHARFDEIAVKEAMTYQVNCPVTKNGAVLPATGHPFRAEELTGLVGHSVPVRITPELHYDYVHAFVGGDWVKLESLYAGSGLASRFALAHDKYKSGLIAIQEELEILGGMPRVQKSAKKSSKAQTPKSESKPRRKAQPVAPKTHQKASDVKPEPIAIS